MIDDDTLVTDLTETVIFQDDGHDPDEHEMGMAVEQEHDDITGGDPEMIKKIVEAHLAEDPKYYTKLAEVGL